MMARAEKGVSPCVHPPYTPCTPPVQTNRHLADRAMEGAK